MTAPAEEILRYRRNHFSARLPVLHRYTRAHFWLREDEPGEWRVGLTSFATRMLGDIVEFDFEVAPGAPVSLGQTIGWIEGFKAVSDLICVLDGEFLGFNTAAAAETESICRKPFAEGWLYRVRGRPDPDAVDVHGYVEHLDRTIDKMLERPWQSPRDTARDDSEEERP